MKLIFWCLRLLLFTIFCFNFATFADNKEDVLKKLKSYIDGLKSVAIDFEQIDTKKNYATGTLIIEKPYKFRCNYYKPFPLLIIGSKNYISVYDYTMNSLNRVSSADNIFRFLLVSTERFGQDFEVKFIKDFSDFYVIEIHYSDIDKSVRITFNKRNNQISEILIFDLDNVIKVNFSRIYNIKNINKSLFTIKNPEIYGSPARIEKEELYKNYNFIN